ncbi:phage portal protein, partial [Lactococcus lactis]
DDVQQVILTLTNYGGEAASAAEFLQKIKLEKVAKIDSLNPEDKTGLDTLTIDIPVEARNSLLDRTREAIFLQAQAVDPTKVEMGTNKSGIALKMLYSLLELKAAAVENEFRPALATLVRAILRYLNVPDADTRKIEQKWTRAAVKDAAETADIIAKLADVTSMDTIAKNNPLVEDPQREIEELEKQKEEDPYAPKGTPNLDDE